MKGVTHLGDLLKRVWKQHWFLLLVCLILGGGLCLGQFGPITLADAIRRTIQPKVTTAIVLFLMGFSLDSSKRAEALRRPFGAGWGCIVNLGLMPILVWPFAAIQQLPDFHAGLILTAVVPCTLATASVFTRKAGGNDAVSLLVTLITNMSCVVVTPFWLQLWFGRTESFDVLTMVQHLTWCVLLPTIAGQLMQLPPQLARLAERYRRRIGMFAQLIVLLLVGVAAIQAGQVLAEQSNGPSLTSAGVMLTSCVLLHLTAIVVAWQGARLLGLHRTEKIAVAIAGSQKTLPVGLLIAATPGLLDTAAPFLTFPLLAYHGSQLILDGMLAERWVKAEGSAL
ncbi:hypothetical protein GC163_02700 [bacterium]|nr:hypothetical protein [bacterium]